MRQSHIAVIGAPMDLGAGRRGVDMGPSALRIARLHERLASLGYTVEDLGNVAVDQPERAATGPSNARYLPEIAHTCTRLAEMVESAADDGRVPVVLGGDHSIGAGTVAGMSRHFAKQGKRLGLIWIDAHADMNTPETSPSGNVHGMPLAAIAGLEPAALSQLFGFSPKVQPANIALVNGAKNADGSPVCSSTGRPSSPQARQISSQRGSSTLIRVPSHTCSSELRFDK